MNEDIGLGSGRCAMRSRIAARRAFETTGTTAGASTNSRTVCRTVATSSRAPWPVNWCRQGSSTVACTCTAPPPVVPRQLPPDPAYFTNRDNELRDAGPDGSGERRLRAAAEAGGAYRAGGAGKTAVALRWLHDNADRFADGQLYAELGALGPRGPATPSEILSGFLRALGVPPDDIPIDQREQSALYRSISAKVVRGGRR